MEGYVLLWSALLLPLVLGMAFKVGTSHVFFSLMAGELLGRYFGHDLDKALHVSAGLGEIAFIVVPMVATAYLLRGDLSRKRLVIHAVPLLVTGVIAAAFILPALPEALRAHVAAVPAGDALLGLHRTIVGAMIALQLGWLWFVHGTRGKRRSAHGG